MKISESMIIERIDSRRKRLTAAETPEAARLSIQAKTYQAGETMAWVSEIYFLQLIQVELAREQHNEMNHLRGLLGIAELAELEKKKLAACVI